MSVDPAHRPAKASADRPAIASVDRPSDCVQLHVVHAAGCALMSQVTASSWMHRNLGRFCLRPSARSFRHVITSTVETSLPPASGHPSLDNGHSVHVGASSGRKSLHFGLPDRDLPRFHSLARVPIAPPERNTRARVSVGNSQATTSPKDLPVYRPTFSKQGDAMHIRINMVD